MTELLVRDGRLDDADAVAGVHVRSWRAAYRGLMDQSILDGLSIADRAAGWRQNIATPLPKSLGILVAERDGQIVGWCSFGSGRDADAASDGEIYGLYADPAAWSTGAGHALITTAEAKIADAGHERVFLWVLDGNERADAFYEKHGYLLDGGTKLDERPGHTLREHRRSKPIR